MMMVVCAGIAVVSLYGCGFHLRGQEAVSLPDTLTRLKLVKSGGSVSNDLFIEVKNVLENVAKAEVVAADSDDKIPSLVLSGEKLVKRVLAVSATSTKASNYILRYRITIQLKSAKGAVLMKPQTIRLQRTYNFDPADVMAKTQEEEAIRRALRKDAARQILSRLMSVNIEPAN
ncbi:MAG: LPS assembly lipoprotein LptE [Gammaproteobacteria bacterium]|nr:MAG: LPS assembly lipoprotein LptE [Gammaproteobacteria bacterium]